MKEYQHRSLFNESVGRRPQIYNFIKKETPTQVEIQKIQKNSFFTKELWTPASGYIRITTVISSNINEVIRVISCFFSRENFTRTKKHTKHRKQTSNLHSDIFICLKSTKSKQATYAHKRHKNHRKHKTSNKRFSSSEKGKKDKKHKNANKQISDFLPLRHFLSA